MTTNRPSRPATQTAGHYLVRDHKVVADTTAQLRTIVDNHRRRNTLVGLGKPRRQPDGTFHMTIRIREYQVTRPAVVVSRPQIRVSRPNIRVNRPTIAVSSVGEYAATRARRSWLTRTPAVITAIAGTAIGFLVSVAYLIGLLVEFTATNAAAILGVLALAAIVTGVLTRRPRRRHCPGC